jgi:hypothetical protein
MANHKQVNRCRRIFLFFLFVFSSQIAVFHIGARAQSRTPRFKDYPSGPIYRRAPSKILWPKDVDPHDPNSRLVASLDPIPKRSNFASHYVIVEFGCGTNCGQIAIVDMKTGHLLEFAPYTTLDTDPRTGVGISYAGISFRRDSRLLIASGCFDWDAPDSKQECGTKYFLFTGSNFELLKFVSGHIPEHLKKLN